MLKRSTVPNLETFTKYGIPPYLREELHMKGLKPRTHLTLLRFMQGGVGETWLQALNPERLSLMKQETKLQDVKLNYFGSLTV